MKSGAELRCGRSLGQPARPVAAIGADACDLRTTAGSQWRSLRLTCGALTLPHLREYPVKKAARSMETLAVGAFLVFFLSHSLMYVLARVIISVLRGQSRARARLARVSFSSGRSTGGCEKRRKAPRASGGADQLAPSQVDQRDCLRGQLTSRSDIDRRLLNPPLRSHSANQFQVTCCRPPSSTVT